MTSTPSPIIPSSASYTRPTIIIDAIQDITHQDIIFDNFVIAMVGNTDGAAPHESSNLIEGIAQLALPPASLRRLARPALPRLPRHPRQHRRQKLPGIAPRRLDDVFRWAPGDD